MTTRTTRSNSASQAAATPLSNPSPAEGSPAPVAQGNILNYLDLARRGPIIAYAHACHCTVSVTAGLRDLLSFRSFNYMSPDNIIIHTASVALQHQVSGLYTGFRSHLSASLRTLNTSIHRSPRPPVHKLTCVH